MIPNFRAWYVLAEEMIDEILMISFVRKEIIGKFSDGSTSVPLKFEDKRNGEDVILMQSTGLKDKNGKEIFEGDILYGYAGEDFWEIVEFDTEEGKWIRKDIWYNSKLCLSENNEFMEIVGNIYENPELLEAEE